MVRELDANMLRGGDASAKVGVLINIHNNIHKVHQVFLGDHTCTRYNRLWVGHQFLSLTLVSTKREGTKSFQTTALALLKSLARPRLNVNSGGALHPLT